MGDESVADMVGDPEGYVVAVYSVDVSDGDPDGAAKSNYVAYAAGLVGNSAAGTSSA